MATYSHSESTIPSSPSFVRIVDVFGKRWCVNPQHIIYIDEDKQSIRINTYPEVTTIEISAENLTQILSSLYIVNR